MKIRYASDLHLEAFYGSKAERLFDLMIGFESVDHDSVLVLAGDISSRVDQLEEFLNVCCSQFKFVVYVPGNHEFYHTDMGEWQQFMKNATLNKNIHVSTSVECFVYDGVRFITSTLWADGGKTLEEQFRVQKSLSDFRYIRVNGRNYSVWDMKDLNLFFASRISTFLSTPHHTGKTVVVTHHLPTRQLISERFNTDYGINGGFACDIFDSLMSCQAPDHWIFGHTHDTISKKIYDTWFWCNPRGYKGETSDQVFNFFGAKHFNV
jgi:predicted phosphodiesterase